MEAYLVELEDLISQQNGWDGKTNFIANGMSLVKKSYIITGHKQNYLKILQNQILKNTMEQLTLFQEDFPANHIPQQEKGLGKRTQDISGQRCLEQFEKFNRVGLWAKTFADLLIGMEGWYSMKCSLSWKLRATKSHRFYFQLVPSTLPTEGIESGLWLSTPRANENPRSEEFAKGRTMSPSEFAKMGLLPTPTTQEAISDCKLNENGRRMTTDGKDSRGLNIGRMETMGMLPTPTAMDSTNATATMKSTQVKEGSMHSVTLTRAMSMGMLPIPIAGDWKGQLRSDGTANMLSGKASLGMLPTPQQRDWNKPETPEDYMKRKEMWDKKGINLQLTLPQYIQNNMLPTPNADLWKTSGMSKKAWEKRIQDNRQEDLNMEIYKQTGQHSQNLNPQFVLEMMGFPTDWTELPFLSGETNQSKQQGTQSSRK
jgi:hypothetical protein